VVLGFRRKLRAGPAEFLDGLVQMTSVDPREGLGLVGGREVAHAPPKPLVQGQGRPERGDLREHHVVRVPEFRGLIHRHEVARRGDTPRESVGRFVHPPDGVVPGRLVFGLRDPIHLGLALLQGRPDARLHVLGADPVEGDAEVVQQQGVGGFRHGAGTRGRRGRLPESIRSPRALRFGPTGPMNTLAYP